MGQITITVSGSFRKLAPKRFSAISGGHAQAVAEAIEFLSGELLPDAIQQDHKLHEGNHYPEIGFGEKSNEKRR